MSNWIITNSAREHYLSGDAFSSPTNVPSLREIAHSLAQINRFTGHCVRPYSVAEHSLLVYELARADGADTALQLAALMHDAHECITGDTSTPVKREVGPTWNAFENRHQAQVLKHYRLDGVSRSHAHEIRRWDLQALATERRDLTLWRAEVHAPWPILDTPGLEIEPVEISLLTPRCMDWQWSHWREYFNSVASALFRQWDHEVNG